MPYRLFVTMADGKGRVSTVRWHTTSLAGTAAFLTLVRAMSPQLRSMCDVKIKRQGYQWWDENPAGIPGSAAPTWSDIEEKARFRFLTADGEQAEIYLPAFSESKFVDHTDQVDLTNSVVATWIGWLLNGYNTGGGLTYATDARGQRFIELLEAKKDWRQRGKS